jgi:hypothetical protein
MLPDPFLFVIDFNFIDFLRITIANRYRYPLPVLRCLDTIAILPFVFLVLDIIQIAENIGLNHLMDITEPGKILRLVNGNYHLE